VGFPFFQNDCHCVVLNNWQFYHKNEKKFSWILNEFQNWPFFFRLAEKSHLTEIAFTLLLNMKNWQFFQKYYSFKIGFPKIMN
jgi:hypothetical protein